MAWITYSLIFIVSIWFMRVSSEWVIGGLMRLSKALKISEFVVGFCVMATAASLPNLFVGITSATKGIPELSLGDVFGNNFVAITLAVAIAILFAPKKEIETGGKTIRTTAFFTMATAILPIILIFDGVLSRFDGVMLLGLFACYILWLISKRDDFSPTYNHEGHTGSIFEKLKKSIKDIFLVTLGVAMLVAASIGIVFSASFFTAALGIPLVLVGILVTGVGNALPEVYFAIASAKRGETQMIIGNLMGAVIFPATLVLGIVALIQPINVGNLQFPITSRIFLFVAAVLFFLFARSKEKISLGEGGILLVLYALFVFDVLI